ncbi:PH domain-containing protein [Aeoliella mucimassa]|uniref:Bacterial membrane flanked domain protein n=1 Tax=Aeoliella mucimassa TaxID=2527972 RepID=A0A518AHH6_9BACT|nr:PH domain-containing protein [Aeoliella mucimassa]QDU54145.1 Bacterial membrane flanked domain protein [Aeoliella mucimassa]
MNCPSCQTEVNEKVKFCPECGARIADDEALIDDAERDADFPLPGDNEPKQRFQNAVASRQSGADIEEDDIWSGSYSPKAMVGWWISAAVITVVALIASLIYFSNAFWWIVLGLAIGWAAIGGRYAVRRLGVTYHLTSQRFIHETGLLWRRTDRIELIDIDDVTFRQGPVERMFNVGTIELLSSDITDPKMTLPGIEGVRSVADLIDDLRRKERRRRGLHIEAV